MTASSQRLAQAHKTKRSKIKATTPRSIWKAHYYEKENSSAGCGKRRTAPSHTGPPTGTQKDWQELAGPHHKLRTP